jgi:putative ATPase
MPARLDDAVKPGIARLSAGDARTALNTLDIAVRLAPETDGVRHVTWDIVQKAAQRSLRLYDKSGDAHYDTISAFIKSLRGSDPDGAMLWLAKMLDAGEDPLFIARRMVVLASEDVGNADPFGLVLANAAFQAAHAVGMPEARIILAHAANYLASAPKSNASYIAVEEAFRDAKEMGDLPVPMHLRNAPTGLMKASGYGEGYKYAHDFDGGFTEQEHLPEALKDRIYYRPKPIGREAEIKKRLEGWWAKRRNPFKSGL